MRIGEAPYNWEICWGWVVELIEGKRKKKKKSKSAIENRLYL